MKYDALVSAHISFDGTLKSCPIGRHQRTFTPRVFPWASRTTGSSTQPLAVIAPPRYCRCRLGLDGERVGTA